MLPDYECLLYPPSMRAASALCLAMKITDNSPWVSFVPSKTNTRLLHTISWRTELFPGVSSLIQILLSPFFSMLKFSFGKETRICVIQPRSFVDSICELTFNFPTLGCNNGSLQSPPRIRSSSLHEANFQTHLEIQKQGLQAPLRLEEVQR